MNKCTAIISGAPLSLAPYLKFYIDVLEEYNLNYILLNVEETGDVVYDSLHQIVFRCPVRPGVIAHTQRLVYGLLFIIKNLIKYHCGRIIVAPTRTGIKLNWLLRLFFKNRYIFDIRDYTNEDDASYKRKEDKLIAASAATFISSQGYKKWLPPSDKLRVTHNIPRTYCACSAPRELTYPIRIGWVGMVSYYKENCELIQKLGGNNNFELFYCGDRTSEWSNAVVEELVKKYQNVYFEGHFRNDQKALIYQKIDLINGIFGNNNINAMTLIPNRLYDAAIYKIPIIVSSGSWIAECVEKYGIGLSVNIYEDDVSEKIKSYFAGLDREEFTKNCNQLLKDVSAQQSANSKWIHDFLK